MLIFVILSIIFIYDIVCLSACWVFSAVFLSDHTTGCECEAYLLQQMDMGSLTCAQISVHAVHMKWGQAQTSLHKT